MKKTKFLTRTTGVIEKVATVAGRIQAHKEGLADEHTYANVSKEGLEAMYKLLDRACLLYTSPSPRDS